MDWTYWAFLVVVGAVGAAVLVGLALRAGADGRARAIAMTRPPARRIPHFDPDRPAPAYLSELESRKTPAGAPGTDLADADREALRSELAHADATLDVGYVIGDFATDRPTGWAVLEAPRVAVLPEGARSIRELLPVVERAGEAGLVVVATSLDGVVLDTLRANTTRRLRRFCVVVADEAALAKVAEACGATPLTRADLQSGWCPDEALGHMRRWVSGPTASWLWREPSTS